MLKSIVTPPIYRRLKGITLYKLLTLQRYKIIPQPYYNTNSLLCQAPKRKNLTRCPTFFYDGYYQSCHHRHLFLLKASHRPHRFFGSRPILRPPSALATTSKFAPVPFFASFAQLLGICDCFAHNCPKNVTVCPHFFNLFIGFYPKNETMKIGDFLIRIRNPKW